MTTTSHPVRRGLAAGITMLAATALLISGTLSILRGIAGVTEDEVFLIPSEYIYQLDVSAWGGSISCSACFLSSWLSE
ncbi:hypothetical protein ACFWU7_29845 [Nocardia fluminea]|uniref:DUF7144 family membrane protein n=1 Tax=Nocardia fluminea TaxID=134984 RepID=UPI00364FC51F